jgi:hypothetical protein
MVCDLNRTVLRAKLCDRDGLDEAMELRQQVAEQLLAVSPSYKDRLEPQEAEEVEELVTPGDGW